MNRAIDKENTYLVFFLCLRGVDKAVLLSSGQHARPCVELTRWEGIG